jgi:hypothetical protein
MERNKPDRSFRESGDGWGIPSDNQQPVWQDMQLHEIYREREEEVDQESHDNEMSSQRWRKWEYHVDGWN